MTQDRDRDVRRFKAFETNVFELPLSSDEPVWNVRFDVSEAAPEEPGGIEGMRLEAERRLTRADEALAEAAKEAGRLIEETKRRVGEIEATAYQAGFQQGEEAGQHLSDQKTESVLRSLGEVLEQTEAQRAQLVQSSEEHLVRLAFLIALRLVHREIRQDPSVVLDVVREAVSRVRRASRLTLYVSPHDFKFIEGRLDDLAALTSRETHISVEPDPNIARGGCRVTSNAGEVDAMIDSMIRNLQERLWKDEEGGEKDEGGRRKEEG